MWASGGMMLPYGTEVGLSENETGGRPDWGPDLTIRGKRRTI